MGETARVLRVGKGVAAIAGFSELRAGELVAFPGGLHGMATDLDGREAGVVLLGPSDEIREGAAVRRTGRVADTPVGPALLGRVVDPLGRPLDDLGRIDAAARRPVDRPAPPIMHRAPVSVPLQTGIKAIDATIPIGRGQRELILGDRQTGKTSVALDTILNQKDTGVVSVYCAIGQRAASVVRVIATLRDAGALKRTVVVVAGGEDAPGLQYLAPYAATAMAEAFMEHGTDVLIVYDDLTRHARAYRELSLLLRRPPGREAYPGDIFHIHARLLERATRLRPEHGGGSLTALPVIETQAQNISAYIPTNLISITDGQVFLSPALFARGQLPAVDIGRSVSRVGGKAQHPAYRAVAGDLRLAYAQFEELETFARFGTQLDAETRRTLERGRRVRAILRQPERDHLSVAEQIAVLLATTEGLLDEVALERCAEAERAIRQRVRRDPDGLAARLATEAPLARADREALLDGLRDALASAGLVDRAGGDHGHP
ncbi:F0F1 ATP synthase subunit alpha [Hyphomicrobiales bacterium FT118]|uniref:ATP synthase subunit alpha n=2 Tax=Futiania mangrovi TaxID=2959716 RepID=A0A9J6PGS9_9PROT|nr:F0F1 ATP synthase subunit alpha [Futiania mangrovii]